VRVFGSFLLCFILCYQHRDNIARFTILSAKFSLAIISTKISRGLRNFENVAILS
jgi:hypothetical protein